MNRLPEGLTAGLSGTVLEELQTVFADLAEEAQIKWQAMEVTVEKLMEDMRALETSRQANKQEWQREREKLIAAAEAARLTEREKIDSNLSQMASQLKTLVENTEKDREIAFALEKEKRQALFLLEQKEEEDYKKMMAKDKEVKMKDAVNWGQVAREKENGALSMVLKTAALKQRLLMELREQAEKWMAPGTSTKGRSAEKTPVVLTSWMVREEWRKVQANKPSLNDGLQTFCTKKDITKLIFKNQKLKAEVDTEYEKKRKCLMADCLKKEEKIRAAELKQKTKLEQQMRKQLEKTQKAELKEKKQREAKEKKEKKQREAKEKKEAEKLARTHAKAERAETRQSRFFFWKK